MAPGVNRWANVPAPRSDTVSPSPFVITNADWTSRYYLAPYLIVSGATATELVARAENYPLFNVDRARLSIGIRADTSADAAAESRICRAS